MGGLENGVFRPTCGHSRLLGLSLSRRVGMEQSLDNEKWANLQGGYREVYDPRPAIRKLEGGDTSAWVELWERLHHQGDVGEASYAAIGPLVRAYLRNGLPDWNVYALAATVEECRRDNRNPPVPAWLQDDYDTAWSELQRQGLAEFEAASDDNLVQSILAVLAFSKSFSTLGRMAMLTEDERREMLDEAGFD